MITIKVGNYNDHKDLINELLEFFGGRDPDVGFYDPDSWKGQGETMCDEAAFHVTAEGYALHKLYYNNDCAEQRARFDAIAAKHGFGLVEQGYHWSFHFYKDQDTE